jgi:hypothetical protein
MSSGYGRFVAALGGLVAAFALIAAAPPEGNPKRDDQSQYADANSGQGRQESLTGGDRENLAASREANRIAERANLIAEAQRSYAFVQLFLGGFGVVLTFVAAVAAICAAGYAKKAADAARDSADADNAALEQTRAAADEARKDAIEQAKRQFDQLDIAAKTASAMKEAALVAAESNQIARETAATQLRPYVYVMEEHVSFSPSPGSWEFALDDTAKVGFSLRNFGQTPAKNVTVRVKCEVRDHWSDHKDIDLQDVTTLHRSDIPPSHQIHIEGYAVSGLSKIHTQLLNAERTVFLAGEIKYEDGSGKKYRTIFNRACSGPDYFSGKFFVPPSGNTAT